MARAHPLDNEHYRRRLLCADLHHLAPPFCRTVVSRLLMLRGGCHRVEFVVGCIVNLLLGWNVWNYEQLPLHLFGQICPLFSILWFFLSALLLPLCRLLRKKGIC